MTRSLHDDVMGEVPIRDDRDDSGIDANAQVICAQVTYTRDFIYLKKRSLYEDVWSVFGLHCTHLHLYIKTYLSNYSFSSAQSKDNKFDVSLRTSSILIPSKRHLSSSSSSELLNESIDMKRDGTDDCFV